MQIKLKVQLPDGRGTQARRLGNASLTMRAIACSVAEIMAAEHTLTLTYEDEDGDQCVVRATPPAHTCHCASLITLFLLSLSLSLSLLTPITQVTSDQALADAIEWAASEGKNKLVLAVAVGDEVHEVRGNDIHPTPQSASGPKTQPPNEIHPTPALPVAPKYSRQMKYTPLPPCQRPRNTAAK